ncbi:MAG: M23 family metallopeptidase [Acidobacteria bacterium]|nr:M23 family metallopeptidase [Acidobacteriota bacterium]MCG3193365.1 hypothetical protein [Thermoanaerobaculia bacterium]MCK6682179.1 M23 family metallopeptidase [Thermoanaerobaculia bacterium]
MTDTPVYAPGTVKKGLAFPLGCVPTTIAWSSGPGVFDGDRGGGRSHPGIDLFAPHETAVYSMARGRVVRIYEGFLGDMVAIQIDHREAVIAGTVLYGELDGRMKFRFVEAGDDVEAGDQIGVVGLYCSNQPRPMLHLEYYPGLHGAKVLLSSKRKPAPLPYERHVDPENPAVLLKNKTLFDLLTHTARCTWPQKPKGGKGGKTKA